MLLTILATGVLASNFVGRKFFELTEPVLGPLRRAIPALRVGGMAIDLSPMIVMFVIYLLLVPLVCTG